MKAKIAAICLSATLAPIANAELFSIAGDDQGVPRDFHEISTNTSTTTQLFPLGDSSIGFNGGLTFNPGDGLFYAVRNDSDGNSALTLFSLAGPGTLSEVFSLGVGFNGGLAFNPADGFFYAISNDVSGASTINRIDSLNTSVTPLFGLGVGFNGGLTYNADDGLLYAVSNDELGSSTLQQISVAGSSVMPQFALGIGFYGGVAYDPDTNFFYAIASDSNGNSTLFQATTGGIVTPSFAIGSGFNNAGLAVPEPSALALLCIGFYILAAKGRK
jgi:hypothetical protein